MRIDIRRYHPPGFTSFGPWKRSWYLHSRIGLRLKVIDRELRNVGLKPRRPAMQLRDRVVEREEGSEDERE